MHHWLSLTIVLLFQEPLSATFVVLEVVRAGYPINFIHLLWLALTVSQIYLGYVLGRWGQTRFATTKLANWIKQWIEKVDDIIGRKGEKVALIFFTLLTLPFFSGFIASWLPIPVWSILLFSTLGSFIWYLQVWIGVYGAGQFSSGLVTTVISVVIIGTLVSIPFARWRKRLNGPLEPGSDSQSTIERAPAPRPD
jgi:membrane protein YqaA with SNARE-associated domain